MKRTISLIAKIKAKKPKAFKIRPIYNEVMDSVDVFWKDDFYYSRWISAEVSLHKAIGSNEVIGVQICGISRLLPRP